ncbi:MAG: ATP-binding protein [Spirochaetaceae bacterium]|nr:ATP-binding protein [Spirochaetaceae bacterium]
MGENDFLKNILKNPFENMTAEEIAAHDEEVRQKEAKQAEHDRIERYKRSGVPERYWTESLDTYQVTNKMQETAARAIGEFLREIKCGAFRTLVLIGSAGTGKTHLACGAVREYGGKFANAPDIVEEIRRAKSFSADQTEKQIIDSYSHKSLLVIDEIGRGIAATDEKYMLYQIINARYNTRKPTVLISNFTKADFLKYIGVAAADRLVESGDIVEMNGESYRKLRRQNETSATAV